jgi:ABC-2 type transport system ATP-binding protein
MIEAIELTKQFHNNVQSSGNLFTAVDRLSLSVKAGEVLALLGPNGAGKTTTVRMLSAVLTPTSGQARVGGYDVVEQASQVRRVVGVLTEAPGLYLRMQALEYLDLVRTMMHDPSVLLLDEPTSAMDPHSAKLVRDAITELRSDQRTIVICTHNLPEAEQLADRIAIIRRGQIIARGSVEQLKSDLLGAPLMELRLTGSPNGLLAELEQRVKLVEHGDNWLRYQPGDVERDNPALVRWLAEHGADVLTLSQVPRSLEAVYLKVVEEA